MKLLTWDLETHLACKLLAFPRLQFMDVSLVSWGTARWQRYLRVYLDYFFERRAGTPPNHNCPTNTLSQSTSREYLPATCYQGYKLPLPNGPSRLIIIHCQSLPETVMRLQRIYRSGSTRWIRRWRVQGWYRCFRCLISRQRETRLTKNGFSIKRTVHFPSPWNAQRLILDVYRLGSN